MINNNLNNINQQHIAPKTTHWALREIFQPPMNTDRHGNAKL